MLNDPPTDRERAHVPRLHVSVRCGLIGGVVVAKTADALVTAVALTNTRSTERNPVAAAVFETIGVLPGIVASSLLALVVAVGGIELAASSVPNGRVRPTVVRLCGYGPLFCLWSLVTLSNLTVVGWV